MKILLSGYHNPLYPTIIEYIENGIQASGHNPVAFDDHQFMFPGRIRNRVSFLNLWDNKNMNRKLYSRVLRERPDLVIVAQGFSILKETVKKIRSLNIPIVLWVIDAPVNFSNILDAAPCYNFIFCGGTEAVEIFQNRDYKNVEWLPFAFDQVIHLKNGINSINNNDPAEVVFVGSHYPSREKILESLIPHKYDLGIWGSGWDRISSGSPLKNFVKKTHTKPEEWIRIFCRSKIILVTHYCEHKDIPVYQASPKVYEAMACGGFVICDDQKDVKTLFKDGEHLVIFKDTNDLNAKLKYYLEHDEERAGIAAEGHKEVFLKHSYTHRIKQMLTTLESSGILPGNRSQ